jgi:hypothetical protein
MTSKTKSKTLEIKVKMVKQVTKNPGEEKHSE